MNNDEKIRPLCLSFWSPPAIRPQAILIGKMLPEWIKQGISPVLITYQGGGKFQEPITTYQIPQPPGSFLNRIPWFRTQRDKKYYTEIVEQAEKIIKKHDLNIVYSFAKPEISNIIGAMIKEKTGIKFIAHFSDPWYDSPYYSNILRHNKAKRTLKEEEYVIKMSDKIIFIAQELKDIVMKKFPATWAEKGIIVPHCYTPEDYPNIEKKIKDEFVISHLGIMRKQRNPEVLFKAVNFLRQTKPNIYSKIQIKLIGAINNYTNYTEKELNKLIIKYKLHDKVSIYPPVDFKESLKLMVSSDCLVVIDMDEDCPFILSKVVDYAGSQKPIAGIMRNNNPTGQFIRSLGYKSFEYSEYKELALYIQQLITNEINPKPNQSFLEQFQVKNTTSKLINIFKEIISN